MEELPGIAGFSIAYSVSASDKDGIHKQRYPEKAIKYTDFPGWMLSAIDPLFDVLFLSSS